MLLRACGFFFFKVKLFVSLPIYHCLSLPELFLSYLSLHPSCRQSTLFNNQSSTNSSNKSKIKPSNHISTKQKTPSATNNDKNSKTLRGRETGGADTLSSDISGLQHPVLTGGGGGVRCHLLTSVSADLASRFCACLWGMGVGVLHVGAYGLRGRLRV